MKLIIAGTDGSESAERAVSFAADLATALKASLLIANVSEDGFSAAEQMMLDELHVAAGDALEEISRRILAKASTLARAQGPVTIETMSAAGNPAESLIGLVNAKHADAIVIGRRGRGRLEGLLLGSVSQKLATLAPCTVIIVP